MDRNRLWILGTVLLIVATVMLGWMLGIAPKLSEARAANTERATVEAQNSEYEAQLATLKTQFESIDDLEAELDSLRQEVPNDADLPDFLRQLDKIGQAHSVTFTNIQVSDAQPYAPLVPPEPAASTESADDSATDPAAAAASPQPRAIDPTVNSRITAENFVAIPVSVSVDGSYDNVLAFIKGVQEGTRLTLVTAFNTAAATDPKATTITASVSGLIYVLLDSAAAVTPVG